MKRTLKRVQSFSLSQDAIETLLEAEKASGINRSSIVETAILFWWAQKEQAWREASAVPSKA